MLEEPVSPFSFVAGTAILTNACAIMQNGATTRYNLAIAQWRDFRASLAAHDDRLSLQYVDPGVAVALAERRIRLQLRGLSLLNAAVALFATTTVLGLAGAFLVQARHLPVAPAILFMVLPGAAGLLLLLAATVTLCLEGACGRALLRQHLEGVKPAAAAQGSNKASAVKSEIRRLLTPPWGARIRRQKSTVVLRALARARAKLRRFHRVVRYQLSGLVQ